MKGEKAGILLRLSLFFIVLILLGAVSACGRKGDPVPIIPSEKSASSAAFSDHMASEDTK